MAKIIFAKPTLKCHVMFTSLFTCRSLLTVIMVLVKRWDFGNSSFIYLFVLVLLGYARVGRYHLELKFDNYVMLSVTAFSYLCFCGGFTLFMPWTPFPFFECWSFFQCFFLSNINFRVWCDFPLVANMFGKKFFY